MRSLEIFDGARDNDEDDIVDVEDRVINFTLLPAGKGEFYGTAPSGLTKRGLRRRRSLK